MRAEFSKMQRAGVSRPFRRCSIVPLWVSICSPGIARRPQVHCGCSMEELFVFKLYDPSLNSAKKGRSAMTIKIKWTRRDRSPFLKDLSNKVSYAEKNMFANNIRQLTSVQLEG